MSVLELCIYMLAKHTKAPSNKDKIAEISLHTRAGALHTAHSVR